ncbi:hypothetical protein PISMIDRAFT_442225 [Pisolithus microcarpus 441]|uniref:Uncharacterized protein n=1 Tax=Pisolithus microcarpus 441 TaxID=765257 RepID=A0A0D0ACH9_9AGAM|nr:hypothetical protein PISMIDRAFT_442225 [Pisolithus microcarpus 441]
MFGEAHLHSHSKRPRLWPILSLFRVIFKDSLGYEDFAPSDLRGCLGTTAQPWTSRVLYLADRVGAPPANRPIKRTRVTISIYPTVVSTEVTSAPSKCCYST